MTADADRVGRRKEKTADTKKTNTQETIKVKDEGLDKVTGGRYWIAYSSIVSFDLGRI